MADNSDPFPKLASVYKSSHPQVNQLNHYVANINLNSQASDSNVASWESRNGAGCSAVRPKFPQNSTSIAWGHPDAIQKLRMCGKGESGMANGNSMQAQNADLRNSSGRGIALVSPPLQQGSHWSARADHTQTKDSKDGQLNDEIISKPRWGDDEENDDVMSGDDDDSVFLYDSDDLSNYDSDLDSSEMNYETLKKSKWFKGFFKDINKLPTEEINSPSRQWHCPACQGGPGAIDWYRGLEPLMHHARTKQARRVKLHRKFVEILDQELQMKGTSVTLSGEVYGRWEGLDEKVNDHEIIWPPMVVVTNTRYQLDDNNKVQSYSTLCL
jgi:hypothetical protein